MTDIDYIFHITSQQFQMGMWYIFMLNVWCSKTFCEHSVLIQGDGAATLYKFHLNNLLLCYIIIESSLYINVRIQSIFTTSPETEKIQWNTPIYLYLVCYSSPILHQNLFISALWITWKVISINVEMMAIHAIKCSDLPLRTYFISKIIHTFCM